jgi:sodium pump decarboxylase gamma subunit
MAVGMFVVFLFLGCLIGAMTIMGWLNKKFPDNNAPSLREQQHTGQLKQDVSAGVVAAITAAVYQHRNK